MGRNTIIYMAKEAYWLATRRGLLVTGFTLANDHWHYRADGWHVILKQNGALLLATRGQ